MTRTDDSGARPFTISRQLQAPRELVWQAWREPERLARWWGPKGCTIRIERLDFRPGGFFHYAMTFPAAPPMWGRFLYTEITAPERIVWLNAFANERCGISRAPFSEHCPLEIVNEVTLRAEAGATRLSLRAQPLGETAEERQFFEALFPSLEQGYGGSLDALAEHLADQPRGA